MFKSWTVLYDSVKYKKTNSDWDKYKNCLDTFVYNFKYLHLDTSILL